MALSIDFAAAETMRFRLVGDLTISSMVAPKIGQFNVIVEQDGVGGRVITWPSNVKGVPIYGGTAGDISLIPFLHDNVGNFICLG